ncbi:MAG: helix-turn-helix domain-containing protein [Streptosporangiaceae bacterium]
MSIGGALAEARSEAGLSVTEVSERTRIRAAIIRDIERDDYAACGGDFYARGHIRAIAKVVGADPVPLIAEYDAARMPPDEPDGEVTGAAPLGSLAAPSPGPSSRPAPAGTAEAEPASQLPAGFGRDELTSAALQARLTGSGQPAGGRLPDPAHAAGPRFAEAARGAGAWLAAQPGRVERLGGRSRADRSARRSQHRPRLTAALALALLVAIGLLIYLLVSGSSGNSSAIRQSGVAAQRHHGASATRHGGRTTVPGPASTGSSEPPAVLLTPASIAAFGPSGLGRGDNPQSATLAIDGNPRTAWHTDWYTTPDLGGLQSGTGLLLDMGQPVGISSATILFGSAPGGEVQLRAGNAPVLASLQPVAQAADPGGAVTVPVSRPVRARYLLVWLTRLPRDTSGTFEAFIYDVAVRGTRRG